MFIFAINAVQTREKYTGRLKSFLAFNKNPGSTVHEQCKFFVDRSRHDSKWPLTNILRFLQAQKERVESK
jgi:hypothetical protein